MVMVGTGGRAADSVDNCMIFIFLVPVVAFKFASFKKGKKKRLYLCLVYHLHFLKGFGAMVSVSVLSYYK